MERDEMVDTEQMRERWPLSCGRTVDFDVNRLCDEVDRLRAALAAAPAPAEPPCEHCGSTPCCDPVPAPTVEYRKVGGGFRFVGPDDPLHEKRVLGIVMMDGCESESDVAVYREVRREPAPQAEPIPDVSPFNPEGITMDEAGGLHWPQAEPDRCPTCRSDDPAYIPIPPEAMGSFCIPSCPDAWHTEGADR